MDHCRDFVLGFAFSLWTSTVYLSMIFWTVEGQFQVICSSQPIVAALGEDVILPCHVEPLVNVERLMVTWWRPDVPPDPGDPLSHYKYVHCYNDTQDVEDMKMSSYAGRTELVKGDLNHGNISLKITNVERSDQGIYRCSIPQLGSARTIKLVVDLNSVKTLTDVTAHPPISDPENITDVKGGRPRSAIICFLVVLLLIILGFGIKILV